MQDLVFMNGEKPMTTSLNIAEIFGKNHKDVIRKIEEKKNIFNERNFAPVTYKDAKGEERPMHLLDRDFTTYLIMGFTGAKADEWKLKYIEAFNAMEQKLVTPKSPMEMLELQFAALKEVDSKVDLVNRDLQDFKMDLPILGIEIDKITDTVHKRGVSVLGGKESNAYHDRSIRGKVYQDIYRELKRQFGVSTYKAIKRNQCDMAVSIIEKYMPPIVLHDEIVDCNAQISMEVA